MINFKLIKPNCKIINFIIMGKMWLWDWSLSRQHRLRKGKSIQHLSVNQEVAGQVMGKLFLFILIFYLNF